MVGTSDTATSQVITHEMECSQTINHYNSQGLKMRPLVLPFNLQGAAGPAAAEALPTATGAQGGVEWWRTSWARSFEWLPP